MLNQQVVDGHWNEITGKVKQMWGTLTDSELKNVEGKADELVGLIQRKTGESREQIEAKLEDVTTKLASYSEQASAKVRETTQQASEQMQAAKERVTETARQTYSDAEAYVQQKPAESVAVAFGAGLIAGVVLGIVLRSR